MPGSPLSEKKIFERGRETHGWCFLWTDGSRKSSSIQKERERDPIFPPTWRFGRRRIPWTLGLASLLPGVDITIGVRSIRYRTDRDDWPTTAYTISNLELWNGGPAIFFPLRPLEIIARHGTTRARSLRFWVTAPPSERELCVDRGTRHGTRIPRGASRGTRYSSASMYRADGKAACTRDGTGRTRDI